MTDIKLDGSDLVIEDGDLVLISGADAIRQELSIRLKTFKGEWFRNPEVGMPYFQRILGKNPRASSINGIFREAILSTPGVTGIEDFNAVYNPQTRAFTINFKARISGEDTLEFTDFVLEVA